MKQSLVITNQSEYGQVLACYEENRLVELQVKQNGDAPRVGAIYCARVASVVKNIQAAFLDIGNGGTVYYPLNQKQHFFLTRQGREVPKAGDEILVQITKEGIKTKAPVASGEIAIHGKYLVVIYGGSGTVSMSKKIPRDDKSQSLMERITYEARQGFRYILRTESYITDIGIVCQELQQLTKQLTDIVGKAPYRKVPCCMYGAKSDVQEWLQEYDNGRIERIQTDSRECYQQIISELAMKQGMHPEIMLYEDPTVSLWNLKELQKEVEHALQKRVWLKSGAYLIIEQTEAMVVIDVNTGKAIEGSRDKETHVLWINKEAAREIARQLRIRNLSGIIMVDFIDMKKESNEELITCLKEELQKDRIPVTFVDITKLGIVELTRKKIRKSLKEQVKGIDKE